MCGDFPTVEAALFEGAGEVLRVTWEDDGGTRAMFAAMDDSPWTLPVVDPESGWTCTMRNGINLATFEKGDTL